MKLKRVGLVQIKAGCHEWRDRQRWLVENKITRQAWSTLQEITGIGVEH